MRVYAETSHGQGIHYLFDNPALQLFYAPGIVGVRLVGAVLIPVGKLHYVSVFVIRGVNRGRPIKGIGLGSEIRGIDRWIGFRKVHDAVEFFCRRESPGSCGKPAQNEARAVGFRIRPSIFRSRRGGIVRLPFESGNGIRNDGVGIGQREPRLRGRARTDVMDAVIRSGRRPLPWEFYGFHAVQWRGGRIRCTGNDEERCGCGDGGSNIYHNWKIKMGVKDVIELPYAAYVMNVGLIVVSVRIAVEEQYPPGLRRIRGVTGGRPVRGRLGREKCGVDRRRGCLGIIHDALKLGIVGQPPSGKAVKG